MEKLKKQLIGLFLIICAVFLLSSLCSCSKKTQQKIENNQRFSELLNEFLSEEDVSDSLKKEIYKDMPYEVFLKNTPLKKETNRLNNLSVKEKQKNDSLFKFLYSSQILELQKEHEKYQDKFEILRIKRIWLNSNVTPWTYQSWLAISYHTKGRSSHSIFSTRGSYSGTITPNMRGNAEYVGEYKLDYVNVVFSDNSFKQFKIKDNPEWLLAKTGDKVKVCYIIRDYNIYEDACKVLEKGAHNLIVSTKYVPLFK